MELTTTSRNTLCDAFVDLLDSGTIEFQTNADSEVATCTFAATAFGDAAAGVGTANTITDDSDAAGGTIDHAHFKGSASTDYASLTCTASGGGGDIELTSLTIGAGDTVSITSLTVTMPAT